jgi:hypothetical protein
MGFKKGSLVKHPKYGLAYVGGHCGGRITICDLTNGKRVNHHIKNGDCKFLTYSSWRTYRAD